MPPLFFKTPNDFRKWLEKNHNKQQELLVGFYKTSSGKSSMTWSESVDQALCFGWIDGVRKSIDAISYTIRFTPRKSTSNWSNINIKKIEDLTKTGLMHPAGLKAFEARKAHKSGIYSFEQKVPSALLSSYEKQFRSNKKAWAYFQSQALYYRKTASFWVMSAKQEATRLRRLEQLIKDSAAGQRIGLLQKKD